MSDPVAAKVRMLLSEHGRELWADPQTCRERLRAALPDRPREANVLAAAAEHSVAADLVEAHDEETALLLIDPLTDRLKHNLAMKPGPARWAVRTWAIALGLIPPAALAHQDRRRRDAARRLRRPRTWIRILVLVTLGVALLAASTRWFRSGGIVLPRPIVARVLEPPKVHVGQVRRFGWASARPVCLAAGAQGRIALVARADGSVESWDLQRGVRKRRFAITADGTITCAAFSASGRRAMVGTAPADGGGHGRALVWTAGTDEPPRPLSGAHDKGVVCATFTSAATRLVTGGRDGVVRLWDVQTGREIRRFPAHKQAVRHVAVSQDGRLVVSAGDDQTARLWRLGDGQTLNQLTLEPATAAAVAFAGKEARVATIERAGASHFRIDVWRLAEQPAPANAGRPAGEATTVLGRYFAASKPAGPRAVAFSPDASALAFCEDRGGVHLWSVGGRREIARLPEAADAAAVLPGPRWRVLLVVGQMLRLWRLDERYVRMCLQADAAGLRTVAFSRDARRLVGWAADSRREAWDVATGRRLLAVGAAPDAFTVPTRSPEGRRLLVDRAGALRLWDTEAGKEVVRFEGHRGAVTCAAFSPDYRRALSGGADGTVRLWDLRNLAAVAEFEGHAGAVTSVAFSPDGRLAASAGRDGTVRLWALPTADDQPSTRGRP